MLKCADMVQSWSPISGGVKRYVRDKMRAYARRDDIQHVLVIPGPEDRRTVEGPSTIYEIASPEMPFSKSYRILHNYEKVRTILEMEHPDVVEVGDAYLPAWFALWASKDLHFPVVGYYHSDYPRAWGESVGEALQMDWAGELALDVFEGYLVGLYNRMACTISATWTFQRLLTRMGVDTVARIPLGTDTEHFTPRHSRTAIRQQLALDAATTLLLYVGRFHPMKNLPALLGMMEILNANEHDCHLVCIGDGEEIDMVTEAAAQHQNITRLDYLADQDALAEWYSAADLFINAGTHETFGLVSLEAQACGTRVLGVRGGGMDETLEGETPEIFAATPTPEALAEAVQRILALERDDEATRAARRERIEERFSLDVTVGRLVELYQAVAQGASLAPFTAEE